MTYLLALDQGTSSSRSILFHRDGSIQAIAQQEFPQIYPQPGWVEHDPIEVWRSQWATVEAVLGQTLSSGQRVAGTGGERGRVWARDICAIGITNQRETTVVWHRQTGEPIYNAIVWQDRRTESTCAALREQGHAERVAAKTGLRIDGYFSATKLQWLLDKVPGARMAAQRGELAFGTMDTWILWQLTKGKVHATDVTNASRTMLYNIHTHQWDDDLLRLFNIPRELLPEVRPSSGHFADTAPGLFAGTAVSGAKSSSADRFSLPISGMAGDQQSALFGQACFTPGLAKNTYGTGCFLLMHTGTQAQPSQSGLLTTCVAQSGDQAEYANEGSVFIGGAAIQWLRDGLGAIRRSADVQPLAERVPDSGGVMMVPAFTGLGAPYWQPEARGIITGLTRGTTMAHIARAALESIAFQSAALLQAMNRDIAENGGVGVSELRVDGGACANDLLMQIQADLLGIPVVRPKVIETTALGAAYLAGLGCGVYRSREELAAQWQEARRFLPTLSRAEADARMAQWAHAVRQAVAS